jgi:hypothetical protein
MTDAIYTLDGIHLECPPNRGSGLCSQSLRMCSFTILNSAIAKP